MREALGSVPAPKKKKKRKSLTYLAQILVTPLHWREGRGLRGLSSEWGTPGLSEPLPVVCGGEAGALRRAAAAQGHTPFEL
jgi:hypothetical protein